MKKGLRDVRGVLVAVAIAGVGLIGCGGASASSPERVADQLAESDAALRTAIDEWRAGGDPPASPPPQEVLDQARALQADARFLTAHPNLSEDVLPLIPGSLAAEFRRLTRAHRDLLRLSRGARQRHLKVGAPPPLADLVGFYREANQRYGVGWNYLAAIHLVETKFGRVKNNSVAGAKGPMQFIPSTWRIYGNGGDIQDPHDAILGAANLLRHNGAPPRYGPALRAYNPSGLYVDAVTKYAKEIAANPYGLYYLYCWQP
jgi:soluble lytic murein transglycosylase-like protein